MELVARMLFKLSQDLHHTLSQGPTPPNQRWSATCIWPPELNSSACKYPVSPLKGSRRVIKVVL